MKEVLEEIKTNNTEILKTAEKEIKNPEYVDPKKLAAEAWAAEVELQAAIGADKLVSGQEAEEIQEKIKKEKEISIEARKAHREEFVNKILQMVSDHLQEKIDKKGLAGFFTPKFMKKEMGQGIKGLEIMKAQGLDRLNIPALFAENKPGVLADESFQKEIIAMAKAELDPEDQKMFEDQRGLVGHRMSNVSAG